MTEPRHPGELPPDLPPEYAEAYRRGYERAWATTPEAEPEEELFLDVVSEPWEGPTHREPVEHPARPGWLVPALVGLAVLAVLLAAYALGRLFSSSSDPEPEPESAPQKPVVSAEEPVEQLQGATWDGDVDPLTDLGAKASCVMPPGVDAAGKRITYAADQALDGDFTTAWRCAGNGRGVRFTLTLDEKTRLGEVGLVPGYAKTDAKSHADRYAENNRITRVRWTFADGRSVVQTLDGSPTNRKIQTLRIPPVETDTVTFEILASVKGARDTVAVSEVLVAEAVG